MNLVAGFAPFILFTILSRLSVDLALWVAFATAFVVTIRDFVENPSLRLLDAGSLALFALLALGRGFLDPGLPLASVRFIAALSLFVLLSLPLALKRPFSVDYARLDPREAGWPPAPESISTLPHAWPAARTSGSWNHLAPSYRGIPALLSRSFHGVQKFGVTLL